MKTSDMPGPNRLGKPEKTDGGVMTPLEGPSRSGMTSKCVYGYVGDRERGKLWLAAPDLLEALETILASDGTDVNAMKKGMAAVAKARKKS